jgi:hypothetical protein
LVQEERDLNILLRFPEVTEMFGEDTVFEMQGLLVERFGANLRNRIAHGLLGDSGFYSSEVLYAWWLILRLLCIPILRKRSSSHLATDADVKLAGAPTVSTYGEHPKNQDQRSDSAEVAGDQPETVDLEQSLERFTSSA